MSSQGGGGSPVELEPPSLDDSPALIDAEPDIVIPPDESAPDAVLSVLVVDADVDAVVVAVPPEPDAEPAVDAEPESPPLLLLPVAPEQSQYWWPYPLY